MGHSNKVPSHMEEDYKAIIELVKPFCAKYLDEDYLQFSEHLTAALCRKRPSPLQSGNLNTWAAAIIHALGFINFLFDKDTKPYVSFSDLAENFGLAKTTISQKSKQIRDLFHMNHFDRSWCFPRILDDNSFAWMITLNGFIVDARTLHPEIQQKAYQMGLIPYVPPSN